MASLLDSSAIVAVSLGLPLWRSSLDLGVWATGAITASLTVGIAVGALVGGRLADAWGRTRTYVTTILVYAAGATTVAAANSPGVLVPGVIALGLASGADLPASLAVLTHRTPPEVRGRLVAATHVLWTAGVVLTSAAGLALSTTGTAGIRGLFAALAVAALITAGLRAVYRPSGVEPVAPSPAVTYRRLITQRRPSRPLLLLMTYYALYTLVASTFGNFRTYFLVEVAGATQTVATALSFGTGLLGLAGTVVFAHIADSAWRRRAYPAGICGYAFALALLTVSGGAALPLVVAALVVQNLSFPFVGDAVVKVWSQELFDGGSRATALGLTIGVARLASALFALATPALMAASPRGLFAGLALATAIAGLVGRIIGHRAPEAAPSASSAGTSARPVATLWRSGGRTPGP